VSVRCVRCLGLLRCQGLRARPVSQGVIEVIGEGGETRVRVAGGKAAVVVTVGEGDVPAAVIIAIDEAPIAVRTRQLLIVVVVGSSARRLAGCCL
jgi:hypothetical protein